MFTEYHHFIDLLTCYRMYRLRFDFLQILCRFYVLFSAFGCFWELLGRSWTLLGCLWALFGLHFTRFGSRFSFILDTPGASSAPEVLRIHTPPTLLQSQFGKLVGVGGVGVGEKTSPLPKSHLLSLSVIFQARCGIGLRHLD